uniref:NADH-ubiquinone oxidoreductase chain 4 n=1 Tax=Tanystylum orbiculare TaxID=88027 RepID=E0XLE8_TANOR|nr:NADH dehydrogenase subunit 4 [Tanystylum orbiculare]ADB91993.1 NADH dehydrogenase subunit 4 [Tanystylum orbiculare]
MMMMIFTSLMLIPLLSSKIKFWMYWVYMKIFFMMMSFKFMMMMYNMFNFSNNIFFMFGNDSLSSIMIMLTMWIIILMSISSVKLIMNKFNFLYMMLMLSLMMILMLMFLTLNMLSFYLLFEFILIPTFFLVLGWGYQPERISAGLYFLFYTIFASLPLLMLIIMIMNCTISLTWFYYSYFTMINIKIFWISYLIFFFMVFSFLVKMPIYFFHLWLPKAHVEAPISGSMILAGILLKLGGYGLYRFFSLIMKLYTYLNMYFIVFILYASMMCSLVCLNQIDLKSLVAYSSVVHMGMMASSIFNINSMSFNGGLIMMIGHGLCSSGLFCLCNIIYERSSTRSMIINKGLINIFPNMNIWMFIFLAINISVPPSMNLLGELSLFISLISFSYINIFMLLVFSFFCSCYSIYLYYNTNHGKLNHNFSFNFINKRELMLLFLHLFPLFMFIMKCQLFYFYL